MFLLVLLVPEDIILLCVSALSVIWFIRCLKFKYPK